MAEEKKAHIVKATKKSAPVKEKKKLGARIKKFFKDYKSELKKIVWPTRPQVIKNTGVVLAAIIFIAAVVGVLDLIFMFGIRALTGLGSLIG
jgi:preprotein translocase subunit SecE